LSACYTFIAIAVNILARISSVIGAKTSSAIGTGVAFIAIAVNKFARISSSVTFTKAYCTLVTRSALSLFWTFKKSTVLDISYYFFRGFSWYLHQKKNNFLNLQKNDG
jgi:hypothetical protein